ncbi:helix-turn-helix domain-containing protein [Nocardia sp.]|uniref:helix-turn-helix domain-containing protein n=1 Tax=Nocardia sp. TaxID=1821 RepID=UPI0026152DAD|nr:helix-turn-helix domain-containing protein [Nocardia sp.]
MYVEVETTTLGRYLAALRQREEGRRHEAGLLPPTRKLSRERTAGEAHITASYLTKVERDEVGQVAVGILWQLAEAYHVSEDEWRYVCDLAGHGAPYPYLAGMDLALTMPPLEEFRAALTPMMFTEMDEATTDLVAFVTPQRQLIAANRAYLDTYPTHRPGMFHLEWAFTDESKEIFINWDEQVDLGVAWHRGIMGRYGHTQWAQESHRRLWEFADFRRKWEAQDVAYSRPAVPETLLRIRGRRYAMTIESWQMQHSSLPIGKTRCRLRPFPEQ